MPRSRSVAEQYFQHLCDYEAGEWIVGKVENQRGLYNARPTRRYSYEELQTRYSVEAPGFQRSRVGDRDGPDSGSYFVAYPVVTYEYVEEPRRQVEWQAAIDAPYIKLFGYDGGPPIKHMKVVGISQPTARVAVTWRGLRRANDRELGISGVEIIVYERESRQVLAFRRQFIYAPGYPGASESNSWLQGRPCSRLMFNSTGVESLVRLPTFVAPPVEPMRRFRELVQPLPKSD